MINTYKTKETAFCKIARRYSKKPHQEKNKEWFIYTKDNNPIVINENDLQKSNNWKPALDDDFGHNFNKDRDIRQWELNIWYKLQTKNGFYFIEVKSIKKDNYGCISLIECSNIVEIEVFNSSEEYFKKNCISIDDIWNIEYLEEDELFHSYHKVIDAIKSVQYIISNVCQ
jgi:hypothetical protein